MARARKTIRPQVSELEVKLTEAPSSFTEAGVEEVEKRTESLSSALEAAFKEGNEVRAVLSEHLTARVQDSQRNAGLARSAFQNFQPSMFTSRRNNYVASDGNLARTMDAVIKKGVDTMREAAKQRTLKLHIGNDLKGMVTYSTEDGQTIGRIDHRDLIKYLRDKLDAAPTLQNDPTRLACDAEATANELLNKVDGKGAGTLHGEPNTALVAMSKANTDAESSGVNGFVRNQVHDLMAKVTPPEDQLRFDVQKRAKLNDTEEGVSSFELRAGASDVTAYHDFKSLQIAFEHIWTEIFDGRLKDLGTRLYHTYIDQLDLLGWKPDPNRVIGSIPDLKKLLGNIRELSDVTKSSSAPAINGLAIAEQVRIISLSLKVIATSTDPRVIDAQMMLIGLALNAITTNTTETLVTSKDEPVEGAKRLSQLLEEVEKLLKQEYAFAVFKKDTYNFGILITYRQTWKPEAYQVGDLVSTIPLAPRETRRYTTKHVVKKTRAVKEVEDSLRTTRSESSGTSRVEREIIDKAQSKTNFDLTTQSTLGSEGYKTDVTAKAGSEQASQSEKTKKHFHEAVLKSAEDYKQQHRMEIDTTSSEETEETTFHEIQNPNDELTVTYMFYELQRRYRINEKIHQLTPVILVANDVPAPDAVDDAWLIAHDWILRRVLLDDSFRPALEYLTKSFVGAELNIQILDNNAKAQKQIVIELKSQLTAQIATLAAAQKDLEERGKAQAGTQIAEGFLGTVKRVFDPLQLTGKEVMGTGEGVQALVDQAQESVDRAERERARLLDQMGAATTALQVAIDKLSAAIKEHYDRVAEIDRLRIHVKKNILYYMQAIWNHEPPDQRFFRLYNLDVSIVEPKTTNVNVSFKAASPDLMDVFKGNKDTTRLTLPMPPVNIIKKKLVEIADLDTVLGYKGNYAIYALNENNYLTLHMMLDYLEVSEVVKLRDPDDFGNYTVAELQKLAECMFEKDPAGFDKYREQFKNLIIKRLVSGRPEDDRVIVPTTSLYIEALVGTHPLLEDFKLIHRALDVKKVQAEVRHAELENLRLASRVIGGQTKDELLEDPDVEKKVVVNGNGNTPFIVNTGG